jgi:hypothetical protein
MAESATPLPTPLVAVTATWIVSPESASSFPRATDTHRTTTRLSLELRVS